MASFPCDLHTHSDLSFDGISSPEDMIKTASEMRLKYYALTDHVEINKFDDEEYNCRRTVSETARLIPSLKSRYGGLNFIRGIELGQPLHDLTLTEKVLSENEYDFVIGSAHMLRGYDDFYFLDYKENDPYFLLDIYFEELLEMAEWNGFDILAHLTYPLRYITERDGIEIDMSRYDGIIDEIFRVIIKNGKGIEVNTSGIKKSGALLPDPKYIKRYRELGGTVISLGSDAHRCEDICGGMAEGLRAVKEAGFDEITCFLKRKPTAIKI